MGITFGNGSAPSQITINFDALFTQSLANYGKSMADNISSANPFMHKLRKSSFYQSEDGGTDIRLPLLYALAQADSYADYDELGDATTDGVTESVWEWRQQAVPISYSMAEVLKNRGKKLIDMVDTKMMQAEMGFQEHWPTVFFQGSGDAALGTPKTSPVNGSSNIEPLPKLVAFDPTTSTSIGNINQSTSTWWRNKTSDASAVSTMTGLMAKMDNLYNSCALGIGGPPDLIICDQITYELLVQAIYLKYRKIDNSEDKNFPFEYTRFKKAYIVMDEKIPDVKSNLVSAATYGSLYMLNTQFFRVKYMEGREFDMLKDENGKTFAKPLKGDSRLGHMAWMGQVCLNNRRKHGVMGGIPRTLTAS
jgi:hypothetical protein